MFRTRVCITICAACICLPVSIVDASDATKSRPVTSYPLDELLVSTEFLSAIDDGDDVLLNELRRRASSKPDDAELQGVLAAYVEISSPAAGTDIAVRQPLPTLTPNPVAPVRADSWAFVAASSANVRKASNASSKVVGRAGIGSPVRVVEVDEGFANVRVYSRHLFFDDQTRPTFVLPTAETREKSLFIGWIASSLLDGVPPNPSSLRQHAFAFARANDHAQALPLLSRLWALDPADPEVRLALTRAALATRDYRLAVQVVPRKAFADGEHRLPVAQVDRIDLIQGCTGDLRTAKVVGGGLHSLSKSSPKGDVCLSNVNFDFECAPRDTRPDPGASSDSENRRHEKKLADLRDKWTGKNAAHRTLVTSLLERFPSARGTARLELSSTDGPEYARLRVTRLRPVPGTCGCGQLEVAAEASTVTLRVPRPMPKETMVVWLPLPIVAEADGLAMEAFVSETDLSVPQDWFFDESHRTHGWPDYVAHGDGARVMRGPFSCDCNCVP